MIKRMNDFDMRFHGQVQDFFYRCWFMFGAGADIERPINKDSITKWASDLFPITPVVGMFSVSNWQINFLNENEKVIELVVHPSTVANWEVFTVDISQNLEDYDFYNIKWVSNRENPTKEPSNYSYKQVPKIF